MDLGTTSTCLVLGVLTQRKTLLFSAWIKLAQTGSSLDSRMPYFFHLRKFDQSLQALVRCKYCCCWQPDLLFFTGFPCRIFNRTSGTDGIGIANRWQLLVAVMDKENRKLYLNGELVSQSTSPTSLITLEGNDGRIGSWDEDSGADFEGQIDELKFMALLFLKQM